MSQVNAVSSIDGNQFLVENDAAVSATDNYNFDSVYQGETVDGDLEQMFQNAADEYGVDVSLLKAVAQTESGFDADAVSSCGAQGIMQLMPSTAESLGVTDPFDAQQSIDGGAKMLSSLLDDYNGNVTLALAAYNAGSGSVQKYDGVPPYTETLNYINKINNILGGALDNDSTTIEGSETTDLTSVTSTTAVSASSTAEQTSNSQLDLSTVQLTGTSLAQQTDSLSSNDSLFSYDDYLEFIDTYQDALEKSVQTAQEEETDSNDSSTSELLDGADTSSVTSTVNTVSLLANLGSYASVDNLMKNSPQSLYEAQASVISPLVSKLLG